MIKVLASGVFDRLHPGHLHFLREAKSHGDYLIVCVASDATARKDGKDPILNENQRLELIRGLKDVDEAFIGKDIGNDWSIYDTVRSCGADVIALGFDQKFDEKKLESELSSRGMKVKIVRTGKLDGVRKS